jgi:hypothetical protein
VKGDFHARFRENVGVQFPCVTRLSANSNIMQLFTIFIIAIFFCFSCTTNNSKGQSADNEMVPLASATKGSEKHIASVEKESGEVTCLIKKITEENGRVFIHADYIRRLDGERAIEEAKKRGDADTNMIDGKMVIGVVNDYYTINDNPKVRKLPLDAAAKFELVVNPDRYEGKVTNSLQGLKLIYEDTPFIVTLKNESVIRIVEIFVP